MPAPAIQKLIIGMAELFTAKEEDEDWTKLEQSYDREGKVNVVNLHITGEGIACEQHSNDDTVYQENWQRAFDLLVWRAAFKRASMEDVHIKEVNTAAEGSQSPKSDIYLRFKCNSRPEGSSRTDHKGSAKLQRKKNKGREGEKKDEEGENNEEDQGPSNSDEAVIEGEGEVDTLNISKRSESFFDKAEDFPLAELCSQDPPVRIRLQFRRIYQGNRRTSRTGNWACFFAFLTGRLEYVSTSSWKVNSKLANISLREFLDESKEYGSFVDVTPEDDDWYSVTIKEA